MSKDLIIQNMAVATDDYNQLIDNISSLWATAKEKAINAVNTELLEANWQTGKYIVEFEQGGKVRAEYGKQLIVNLAKDLTRLNGKGFNRSNLIYMRKLYLAFPKSGTLSHKLTWSHYYEILKCDDPLEMQFYMKQCINEGWKVRELKRQMKSCLFQRLALSTDKEGVLALANEGHQVMKPQDIIRDPFVLEFTGLPQKKRYKESELEVALKANMEHFLLELGQGFAFVGRQLELCIDDETTFFPDLIFYHIPQKRYVIIELKAVKFMPEFAGKLNFYVTAADKLLRGEGDNPTVGLLICKTAKNTIVEWSLQDINKPLGVATYQLEEVVERTVKEIEMRKN